MNFKSIQPVYFCPLTAGFVVVYQILDNESAITSDSSTYYKDAHTSYSRFKVPLELLNSWIRIYKRKIQSYDFIHFTEDGSARITMEYEYRASFNYLRQIPGISPHLLYNAMNSYYDEASSSMFTIPNISHFIRRSHGS